MYLQVTRLFTPRMLRCLFFNATRARLTFGDPSLSPLNFLLLFTKVISPKTLLIECDAGSEALERATVTLRNSGSTVLFFSWSRVPRGETIVSANGASKDRGAGSKSGSGFEGACSALEAGGKVMEGGGGRHAHGDASSKIAATRHAALQDPSGRFFCYQVGCFTQKYS